MNYTVIFHRIEKICKNIKSYNYFDKEKFVKIKLDMGSIIDLNAYY